MCKMWTMYDVGTVYGTNVDNVRRGYCAWYKCGQCTTWVLCKVQMLTIYDFGTVHGTNVDNVRREYCVWYKY